MEFRILGPLEVTEGERSLPLGGAKQRALLAILVLHANTAVSTDRLIDLMWGDDPPETAANTLQVYVSQLRKVVEPARSRGAAPEVLVRRAPGYCLRVEPDQLDARRFERLTEEGRAHLAARRLDEAAATLRAGLDLWRGPALADFSYEVFAQSEITRLEELRMSALEERIEADLALGRHASFVGELDALVAQYPLREALRGHLMLALYRSGRQAEALQVYQETRRALDEELGIVPGSALQQLEKGILLQDDALDLPRRARVPSNEAIAVCSSCGSPVADGEELCDSCREASSAESLIVRKTVTVLAGELSAFAEAEELDPEALARVIERSFERLTELVASHGGTVAHIYSDQMIAVFGVPVLHEDDAMRAVRAAAEMRDRLGDVARELGGALALELRLGITTGEVLTETAGPPDRLPTGDAVSVAVRLGRVAVPNEVLLTRETYRLVEDAVEVEPAEPVSLPGRKAGMPAFRLTSTIPGAPGRRRRMDAPMVGREHERASLLQAYGRTVRDSSCHMFTVLGPAGVGKSRLVAEVLEGLQSDATVLTGRCIPYGEGITFLPLAEMVRQLAGIDARAGREEGAARVAALLREERDGDSIAERVSQVCGFTDGLSGVEETFWAVRKLFEVTSRKRPVVAVFDDVHWAEPTLLDLIEHVADWLRGAPLLVVCLARPEVMDQRPSWAGGKLNASSVLLEPLSDDECRLLIRNLLGEDPPAPGINERITAAAEGNPLFVEEMTRMLIDEGHLALRDGHWTASDDLGSVAIPPTIQALIAARLDRLGDEERQVIERAAIVGRVFERRALMELASEALRSGLLGHLTTLMRKELIRPDDSAGGDDAFRFRHMLIRDAAYQEVSKDQRAELHERLADWLHTQNGTTSQETIGYHLERATHYRRELEGPGERAESLGRRAARLLAASGARASARGDLRAAVNFFERAAELLPREHEVRMELMLEASGCLMELGDLGRALELMSEVATQASSLGNPRLAARASVQAWELRSSSENLEGWKEEALRDADAAVTVFEELADELGLAKAFYLRAMVHQVDYRFTSADDALERALEHARAANNEQEETKIYYAYTMSALWGPVPVADAIRRHEDFMARFDGNRLVEASCLRGIAALEAMRGNFDRARALLARVEEIQRDLGATLIASTSLVPGIVELLAGDPAAAEKLFRASYSALQRAGERNARATAAAYVARALYFQERYEEADRFTHIGEELAPEDDLAAWVEWATTRAKVLARRGDLEPALEMARTSVALASEMEDVETHANALLDSAEVLELAGRVEDAVPLVEEALVLHERKGNVVLALRARELLAGRLLTSSR